MYQKRNVKNKVIYLLRSRFYLSSGEPFGKSQLSNFKMKILADREIMPALTGGPRHETSYSEAQDLAD